MRGFSLMAAKVPFVDAHKDDDHVLIGNHAARVVVKKLHDLLLGAIVVHSHVPLGYLLSGHLYCPNGLVDMLVMSPPVVCVNFQ